MEISDIVKSDLLAIEETNRKFEIRKEISEELEGWDKFYLWCQHFWLLLIPLLLLLSLANGDWFHENVEKIYFSFLSISVAIFVGVKYKTH